jgi:dCMP deaminase
MSKLQDFFMKTAFLLAEQSHCVSYHVGGLIVRENRIISMGINGTPPGVENCDEHFEPHCFNRSEHTEWSNQNEIHAEMNALAFAAKHGVETNGCDMYVTMTPCNHCLKNIVMNGIKNVYYYFRYDKSDLNPNIVKKINLVHYHNPGLDKFIADNNLFYDSSKFRVD